MIKGMDSELRDSFKALCVMRGITMRDAVEAFMRDSVRGKTLPMLQRERAEELIQR
jgi:antitoxin component of RelBE/YafQ-DinJ toxin-antitoxin module